MTIESKSAFARRRGRSPTAVGQWIRAGILSGAALEGKGRSARINVEIAEAQLAARLDPGQALGNGADTLKALRALKAPKPSKSRKPSKSKPILDASDEAGEEAEAETLRSPDYAREKARLAKAQADAQELKNAVARGELVPIADVEARWSDIIATARSRMLAVPARVRDALPQLTSTDVGKIDAEIRKALTELGRHTAV